VRLILVRYAELGLKSRAVRKRFEQILVSNMLSALALAEVEAVVTTEQGRVFVETERIETAIEALIRVFGVASVSPVEKTQSDMTSMQRTAAELSLPLLKAGQSFAVRARRVGHHQYSSMDVGREVGSAIYLANEEKKVRVDLTRPDLEFFVEVREGSAYLFSVYVPGPGGLPLGSQGRALALLEKERDALAAWLIMKRGCRVIGVACAGSPVPEILRRWDPEMKFIEPGDWEELVKRQKALAVVFGYGVEDFERMKKTKVPVPAFFPLSGMSAEEIEKGLRGIEG